MNSIECLPTYTECGTDGCCKKTTCTRNEQCASGYHCSPSGTCEMSICSPPPESHACHGTSDCNDLIQKGISTRFECQNGCCAKIFTPIIIDLNGDGFSLTSAQQGVLFDFEGSGHPVRIAWTSQQSDDVWLALDRNGNGRIDDGSELFGNWTPQDDTGEEPNGFRALAVFDRPQSGGNADGWIDGQDAVFGQLLLWCDADHDGISTPQELSKLRDSEIASVSLAYKDSKWVDAFGNQFRYRSKLSLNKHSEVAKWAYDVVLRSQK